MRPRSDPTNDVTNRCHPCQRSSSERAIQCRENISTYLSSLGLGVGECLLTIASDMEELSFSALALHVKPSLEKLTQDVDHDVQHFANEALESKLI